VALLVGACAAGEAGRGEDDPGGRGGGPTARPGDKTPAGGGGAPGPSTGSGGAPPPGASCRPALAPRRVWKLTPAQVANSARALVPAAADVARELSRTLPKAEGSFTNEPSRQDMSPPHFDGLYEMAQTLAAQATANPAALAPCLGAQLADDACVRGFVESFGAQAFRRPLAQDEVKRYVDFFAKEAAAAGRPAALGQVVRAFLLSPSFLYRTELGGEPAAGRVELTAYERAAALSYLLLDGPPDAELADAARRGALATRAQIEAQARRLLGKPGAAQGLLAFFREYVSADAILGHTKSARLFPDWKEPLVAELAQEPLRFVEQVLWREGARFSTLFTADFTVGTKALAPIYGAQSAATAPQKLALPAGQRAGLLTQAGLLARLAGEEESDVIHRGKFVRERLLCQPLPPPPPDVPPIPPRGDAPITQRERLERHRADPACAGCHELMDPLGFPFEIYDAAGRHRTTELGKPIDARGAITLGGREIPVGDAVELGKALAALPEARRCFVQKIDTYANGEDAAGACRADRLLARFEASGGDLLETVVSIVTADEFFTRNP
jgi:hypothetical protein